MLMAVVIMIIIMIELGRVEFSFGASAVQLTIILTCFVLVCLPAGDLKKNKSKRKGVSDIVQLRSSDNFFLFAVKHFELLPPADWHFWETSAAALAIYFCESSIFLNHTHRALSVFLSLQCDPLANSSNASFLLLFFPYTFSTIHLIVRPNTSLQKRIWEYNRERTGSKNSHRQQQQ